MDLPCFVFFLSIRIVIELTVTAPDPMGSRLRCPIRVWKFVGERRVQQWRRGGGSVAAAQGVSHFSGTSVLPKAERQSWLRLDREHRPRVVQARIVQGASGRIESSVVVDTTMQVSIFATKWAQLLLI
jgi:hypothetical protein